MRWVVVQYCHVNMAPGSNLGATAVFFGASRLFWCQRLLNARVPISALCAVSAIPAICALAAALCASRTSSTSCTWDKFVHLVGEPNHRALRALPRALPGSPGLLGSGLSGLSQALPGSRSGLSRALGSVFLPRSFHISYLSAAAAKAKIASSKPVPI